jgi:hypothetical protein
MHKLEAVTPYMKDFLRTILLTFFSMSFLWLPAQKKNSDIADIKKTYTQINSIKDLKKVVLDAEEFLNESPDGGASLTGYFNKEKLVKIISWTGLSYGSQQIEFYLNKGAPVFIHVTEKHFALTGDSIDFAHPELVLQARYYYKQDKLIARKVTGTGFWDASSENDLIPDCNRYAILLEKKNKSN